MPEGPQVHRTGNLIARYAGSDIVHIVHPKSRPPWGPEFVAAATDEEAFANVKTSGLSIGEALLSQELVAGIGNIYKSEGLFVARIHPAQRANQVSAQQFQRLFTFLKPQMLQDESRTGPISTTTAATQKAGTRNFVYRRYHQPCLFCGTNIERIY